MGAMGWAGVIVPEEYDGSAFGYLGLGLILEETGRNAGGLAPALHRPGRRLGPGAGRLGRPEVRVAAKIAAGEAVATLAVDEAAPCAAEHGAVGDQVRRRQVLTGKKTFVLDGEAADLLIVAARTARHGRRQRRPHPVPGEGDAAGVTRTHLALPTAAARPTSPSTGRRSAPTPCWARSARAAILEKVLDRAYAGLAAEMLGTATRPSRSPWTTSRPACSSAR
jgi:alkylation response protein AidB-like acyl-CoA dehydrogenase